MEKVDLKFIYLIVILLSLLSCKNVTSNSLTLQEETQRSHDTISSNTSEEQISDAKSNSKSKETDNSIIYKYVSAPSGLNFRDAPEGNVLGKFPDNLRLQILEVTDVTSEVKDLGKKLTGNWVKVRAERAIGYVFDAFLKDEYREIAYNDYVNELSILSLGMYYDEKDNYYPFVSLTDDFWSMRFPEVAREYEEAQNQEKTFEEYSFALKGNARNKFLNNREIKESDYLFLYNFKLGKLKTFRVKDLILFSHESIYGGSYLTGFDLKDFIDTNEFSYEHTFAHIGKTNPFEIGKLKTAQWQLIDNKKVPLIELEYNNFYKSSNYAVEVAYHEKLNNNDYYYTNLRFSDIDYNGTFLFVISETGKVLYNTEITTDESREPTFYINKENDKNDRPSVHAIGQLFKNKPPVIFGLYSISFGCPSIDFIDNDEKTVYIQCDNRH